MSIFLNGKHMKTKEGAHAYLKRRLHFPSYYGNNLDALYDLLTAWVQGEIVIKNANALVANLGDYGVSMLETFRDADQECDAITVKILWS